MTADSGSARVIQKLPDAELALILQEARYGTDCPVSGDFDAAVRDAIQAGYRAGLREALAKNPNPAGRDGNRGFGSLSPEASGPVGLGPRVESGGRNHLPAIAKFAKANRDLLAQVLDRTEATGDMADAAVHGLVQSYLAIGLTIDEWSAFHAACGENASMVECAPEKTFWLIETPEGHGFYAAWVADAALALDNARQWTRHAPDAIPFKTEQQAKDAAVAWGLCPFAVRRHIEVPGCVFAERKS